MNIYITFVSLPCQINSAISIENYVLGNEKLPAISVSASKDKNGVTHVSLVNIDAKKAPEVSIDIKGNRYSSVTGRILTSGKLQDHNTFENPDKLKPVVFNGARLQSNILKVKLPPFSVVMLELK